MRRVGLLAVVYLALILQSGLSEPRRVSIVRPTAFVRENEYVRYMVQVHPHADNRTLLVAALDGDVAVRQSREQLDGESAPKTRWIEWKHGLPAGEYLVVAVVLGQSRELARASVPVTVLASY